MSLNGDLDVAVRLKRRDFVLDAAFRAPADGVTALFGRSGAGKSTLIAAVAGLARPDFGRIQLGGQVFFDSERRVDLPARKRRVGVVFQDTRLFPHLSVAGNLRYGLARAPRDSAPVAFEAVVELLGLGLLLKRRPASLSGGEKSRVAIGRALLAQPRLLLMDEPLASLDPERRADVLAWLERLVAEVRTPILYVSHNLDEVARLADRMVNLEAGRVAAIGPAAERLAALSLPGSDAGGALNVVAVRMIGVDHRYGLARLSLAGHEVQVPHRPGVTPRRLIVRARDIAIATARPDGFSAQNAVPAVIRAVRMGEGAFAELTLGVGDQTLRAEITRKAVDTLGLIVGRSVHAVIRIASLERG